TDQIQYFKELSGGEYNYLPDGIFVSHAHIGHYTGLMELGREAMNSKNIPVYALPRMASFLENNGPWDQLLSLNNIKLEYLSHESPLVLNDNISIDVSEVPHRDEYSETAAYKIITSGSDYLFIPDIDKWSRWERNIVSEIESVDFAFIDGTFFSAKEIPGRSMEEIPHPFVEETMKLFSDQATRTKNKIRFIHLNHSNPLNYNPDIVRETLALGFSIAEQGKKY
ncbi:MAG: MBL fold metallo-hydrolase, partial [Bacteroidales bacterium]|nr:MBL fold metallo-hydrolase [Bacteroidales bacterium]